jgi:hypothetical protein
MPSSSSYSVDSAASIAYALALDAVDDVNDVIIIEGSILMRARDDHARLDRDR